MVLPREVGKDHADTRRSPQDEVKKKEEERGEGGAGFVGIWKGGQKVKEDWREEGGEEEEGEDEEEAIGPSGAREGQQEAAWEREREGRAGG